MNKKLSIADLPLKDKKVLMRVDFNVPLDDKGHIIDDTRIVASLPSIKYVLEQGGALILISHLGRPKGKVVPQFSLKPCAERLSKLLNQPVLFASDCVGSEAESAAKQLQPGEVLLLENLRFHPGEEKPDAENGFTQQLAQLGNLYVNDAFGTAHRAHASTAAIASFFPGKAAAGFLLNREIEFLGNALKHPKRPFLALIGGAKISSKFGVIKALLEKVDKLLIGGGMAYTFLKAQGISIGNSIHEDEYLASAKELLNAAQESLLLPKDFIISKSPKEAVEERIVEADEEIPEGYEGVDIGPKTIECYKREILSAKTFLWNGPLGVCEVPQFATGTTAIARAVANLNATTIVGGGDSIAALQKIGIADQITHLSTGGGASLEFLEFGSLPGVDALSDQ